jgi:hypothetical protein
MDRLSGCSTLGGRDGKSRCLRAQVATDRDCRPHLLGVLPWAHISWALVHWVPWVHLDMDRSCGWMNDLDVLEMT